MDKFTKSLCMMGHMQLQDWDIPEHWLGSASFP